MRVKELIKQLKKEDPNKQVMIQQGEEHDYMAVNTVKEMGLLMDDIETDESIECVVIKYE